MKRFNQQLFTTGVVLVMIGTISGCSESTNKVNQTTNDSTVNSSVSPSSTKLANNNQLKKSSNKTSSNPVTKEKPSSIQYTKYQKSEIVKGAQYIGSKTIYVPTQGFGSKFEYIQRLKAAEGGNLFVINFTKFDLDLNSKPALTNWKVQNSVKFPISGLGSNPVTAQWLTPPPSQARSTPPVLSFKIAGVYYTIWGSKSLDESQIEKITESLTKFKA